MTSFLHWVGLAPAGDGRAVIRAFVATLARLDRAGRRRSLEADDVAV
jgi:hypothetical protein